LEGKTLAIQRQRIYSQPEVDQIIRASERRASMQGAGNTGHVGKQHVLITNADLIARGDDFYRGGRTDTPLACAFASTPEAARAVTEALNSPEGQAALQYLDDNYPTGIRVRIEAGVAPVQVRYSSGQDIKRVATAPSVLVLVERSEEAGTHGIHIHTAYPIISFRQGRPAWLDSGNVWH
jgi:hypothetical protein